MSANLLVIIFLSLMIYWWGFVQGLFSAWLHLMITIVAGSMALALWEPIVMGVLIHRLPAYAWGVGLLGPFVVWLVGLGLLANWLIPCDIQFDRVTDVAAASLCGLLAGVLAAGLTVIGVGFLPLPADVGGYQPLMVREDGKVVENPDSGLWVRVDHHAATFFAALSSGVFWSGRPIQHYTPHLDTQATLFRMRPDPHSSVVAVPGSVETTDLYVAPIRSLDRSVLRNLGIDTRTAGTTLVVVQTRWQKGVDDAGAFDSDGYLRLAPTQVRLLTQSQPLGIDVTESHAPVVVLRHDTANDRFTLTRFNHHPAVVHGHAAQELLSWVFLIPVNQQARFILLRHTRFGLPQAKSSPEELNAILNRAVDGALTTPSGQDRNIDPGLDADR